MEFKPYDPRDPDRTIARFSLQPVRMGFKSEQEGREIYEDREFVEIISPGLAKSIPMEEVTDEHRRRWAPQYAAFKDGVEAPVTGTPLREWPAATPSTVLMLHAIHIRTVEELAGLNDVALQNLPTGGRELREKAKRFLAAAESTAPMEAAEARANRAEERVKLLEDQVADLAARLEAAETRRGPGRPPKVREDEQEAA